MLAAVKSSLHSAVGKRSLHALAATIMALAGPPTAEAVGSSSIIKNLQTGQCLYPTSANSGTAIYQAPCDASDNRSFVVEYVYKEGLESRLQKAYFRLRNLQTNMCLDLANTSNGNGVPAVQNLCSSTSTQQWSIQGVQGLPGFHQLVNRSGGKCLDAVVNGAQVQQWQCLTGGNQAWWAAY